MAKTFLPPVGTLIDQDQFSAAEVGITHPDTNGYVRLCNNGDIEITAGEGIGIVLHPAQKTILLMADEVKFMTKEDGLFWNDLQFNHQATQFNQPAFLPSADDGTRGLYRGVSSFLPSS